ncbi:hypothetical protein D3Z60_12470 [Lachnospiraceae bacterium]|jgi:hypothetical protein|nr:hypothetical protein [Lachnospiraceae bacterium]
MSKEKDMAIRLSELLYLLFWGIMLFAKGIGLYDGQLLYKIFLVLAFLCIGAKMCITEYSFREWAVIFFLLAWSAVVYRVSGEKGVLICMVTAAGMKNVSVKRCFQTGLIVWAAAMSLRFLTSLIFIGNVETAVQTKNIFGAVLRYFMGYPHPNVLHISYLVLAAFVIYCVKDTYCWKHLLLLMWGNIFLFFYSYSFTGALIVMIYICLSYYVKKKKISKIEYFLVKLVFPGCILVSVIMPMALQGRMFELADKIFNNRINLARHFLTLDNMSLLGNNLAAITTDVITMDNAYLFTLVTYGIPVFLLMCVGYMTVVSDYVKQNKNIELAMICCFLAAGFTEPFLFNTSFKNLTLLFIGEQLFVELNRQKTGQKEFAFLRNWDKTVRISMEKLWKMSENLRCVWSAHRKAILGVGTAAALIISICAGVFYQAEPEVMVLQKENLLIYERVRSVLTAFSLSFICFNMIGLAVCYGKGARKL